MSKWDRPPPPKDWRYFVGGFGKILVALGLLTFGFVAYQLWGTGIETARNQNELASDFDQAVNNASNDDKQEAAPKPVPIDQVPSLVAKPADPKITKVLTPEQQKLPSKPNGSIMKIEIPSINVKNQIVPGVGREDLKTGVGHFTSTPWAGQLGNAAFAGHRTTYGGPFFNLDKLQAGQRILVTLIDGRKFTYQMTDSRVVLPTEVSVLDNDPTRATITLITCTPVHSASHRLIIFGELVPAESSPVGAPTHYEYVENSRVLGAGLNTTDTAQTVNTPAATAPPTTAAPTTTTKPATATTSEPGEFVPRTTTPTTTAPAAGAADTGPAPSASERAEEFGGWNQGWFQDSAAWPMVAGWGAALLALFVLSRLIARWTRHDSIGILAAGVPFLVCLYFFYENVNRLLPAGI